MEKRKIDVPPQYLLTVSAAMEHDTTSFFGQLISATPEWILVGK